MADLKVDEAKKELQGIVDKQKQTIQRGLESTMSDAEKKVLDEKNKKEQDAKALKEAEVKKDAEILAKKADERTEDEKKRALVLEEEARKREEEKLSAEDKIKRIQKQSQERIDELVNRLKQIEDKSSKDAQDLRKELELQKQENENLSKKLTSLDKKDETPNLLKQKEEERLRKYLDEDKEKPREQRKEMSREQLEEWLLEDQVAAQEWISERTLRRSRDRSMDIRTQDKDKFVKDFIGKQDESNKRVLIKHPELDTAARESELKSQGKSDKEIQETLCQENEKYRVSTEIVKENPEKYLTKENGPELVATEMERRIANKSSTTQTQDQKEMADLRKMIEDQQKIIDELQNPSDIGVNSTLIKIRENKQQISEQEKVLIDTLKSLNTPQDRIDSALKKFREKKGIKSA
jgi:hypothetical protein